MTPDERWAIIPYDILTKVRQMMEELDAMMRSQHNSMQNQEELMSSHIENLEAIHKAMNDYFEQLEKRIKALEDANVQTSYTDRQRMPEEPEVGGVPDQPASPGADNLDGSRPGG